MVSITDVARLAGFSTATVSRVLSQSPYPVHHDTRERVLAAAAELGFRPNRLARGLVTARTNMVAVIVHDISDPYFGEVVRALEDASRRHGYQLLTSSSDRNPERELQWLEILLSYRVDGLVFAGSIIEDRPYQAKLREQLLQFRASGRSVVRLAPHLSVLPGITIDQRKAAAAATNYLLDLGHRRIGVLAGPSEVRASRHRLEGHLKALTAAGIRTDEALIEASSFSSAGGAKGLVQLLRRAPDITAVFATSDALAIGALQPLAAAGIDVPNDVSLIGFNDVTLARYVSPPLTTMHVPIVQQASEVFDLLIDGLEGRQQRSRRLQAWLVERGSATQPRRTGDVPAGVLSRLRAEGHVEGRGQAASWGSDNESVAAHISQHAQPDGGAVEE